MESYASRVFDLLSCRDNVTMAAKRTTSLLCITLGLLMLWSEGGLFGRLSACRITGGESFQEKSSSSFNTSHLPQDQNRPLYVILELFRSLFTLKQKTGPGTV